MFQPKLFQTLLLDWFHQNGRQNLPWQHPKTPYRVWLSEVMLQQTQVATVIPYFERFTLHFPNIETLAKAKSDQILSLWAGLGYYARARNLHRAAQIILQCHQGQLPQTLEALQALPGIGRSTAGAILSLAFNQSAPILDGNVKRVLSRWYGISGWPGNPKVSKQLWELALKYTPKQNSSWYTQAIMDLGSLVCIRKKPHCEKCPISPYCVAYAQQRPWDYPASKPIKARPVRAVQCLLLMNQQQEILLEKRPPVGIWGGLWSLPECICGVDIKAWCLEHYFCQVESVVPYPSFRHSFTHFHLEISPVLCKVSNWNPPLQDNPKWLWHNDHQEIQRGLASPIKKLLSRVIQ